MTSELPASPTDSPAFAPFPVAPATPDSWSDSDVSSLAPPMPRATVVAPPSVPSPRDTEGEACRVLHLINGEYYSGAERVQDLLASRLNEFGYAVDFACLKPGRFPVSRQTQTAKAYAFHMNSRLDFRVVGRLCELVAQRGYQLLHAHTPRSVMVGNLVAKRCDIPLVYHVHSPTSRDSTRSFMNKLNAFIERVSMARADRIVTVSASLAQHVASLNVVPERIRVVPNGVRSFPTLPPRTAPVGTWTLATVALFRPRKGTEVLLRALAKLRAAGHDVRLRAVGSFETDAYEQQLLSLTRELQLGPHVDWLGFRSDVDAQLATADLFVLPSLFGEGMPMVVLEAMAMGVPVVGTNVEGVPEVVRDGIDGCLAKPADPGDLAAAIESVVGGDLDWPTMRENVFTRQCEEFSDRSMAAGVASVYEQLVGATTPVSV